MILNEVCKIYESRSDIRNAKDIFGDPFEYLIQNIYENQMIIVDMHMQIMAEEYNYLKEHGEEPVLVGEAGIISTIFGGLFKLLSNAFKAICAFFKNIFSKNKETIESTKKKNNSESDNKTTQSSTTTQSTKQTTQTKTSTVSSKSTTTQSTKQEAPKQTTQAKTSTGSSKSTTTQSTKQETPKKPSLKEIYAQMCTTACNDPSKFGLDDPLYIVDSNGGDNILDFATNCTNRIIDTVNDMCEDLKDRYDVIISIYDSDLQKYDYLGAQDDTKDYKSKHPRSIDAYVQNADRLGNSRYVSGYADWVKHHVTEVMVDYIPEYVRSSDIKTMFENTVGKHLKNMADRDMVKSVLNGTNGYIATNRMMDKVGVDTKKSIKWNTRELEELNNQCVKLFENAKSVIKKAESDLKAVQQIASGAEKEIQRMNAPTGSDHQTIEIGGKRGQEAKTQLLKYFNSLGQSVTYLISTATTTNTQVSSAFAKLITHCINNNINTCKKLASFADRVYQDAFNEWMDNGDTLVL